MLAFGAVLTACLQLSHAGLGLAAGQSSSALVSAPGDRAVVPGWSMQSTAHVNGSLAALSKPGADVSSWYQVSSRATVMAGLLEAGVYNDTELWFSDNLVTKVDYSAFNVPWVYREEFQLTPATGQRYFVQTNGVTSRADVYLNGALIASNTTQVGAYGGQKYDVTQHVRKGANALLISAHPTNYLRDFALGFVDWNPYPPDNGTGVWRNVEILETGPVSISPPRIITDFKGTGTGSVNVTIKADVRNNGNKTVDTVVNGLVQTEGGSQQSHLSQKTTLKPNEQKTVSMSVAIQNPQIWWPFGWGSQPLYNASADVSVSGVVSDKSEQRSFGIRYITSQVNSHNDTAFTVNGHPFLVMGGGYAPDMFLRFDSGRIQSLFQNVLDMGLNTVRLEGKQEQPEFYDMADRMGLMILPGWECCDKWEGWKYNDEADGVKWTDVDYPIAELQMTHEAIMMQSHPSVLGFLVGSDYWPDDRAAKIYVDTLHNLDWPNPIIASAAKRGFPENLGPSGMKMNGPYDWVPPDYWYGHSVGAAFGFGSELGSGVGTPEMGSLKQFLSSSDMDDLWKHPDKGLYHMSSNVSQFYHRTIYNNGLYARYGHPTSLDDYLLKSQVMDYEATRSEYEGYAARKNADRPATGLIYWMLNSVWPNLHWQLFDYYLKGAGAYYGTKMGTRAEHVVYDYNQTTVLMISHSLASQGQRVVSAELIDTAGKTLGQKNVTVQAKPNAASQLFKVPGIDKITGAAFLKLVLADGSGSVLSRNVYWLPAKNDVLDWKKSSWYCTPVTEYANMTALFTMKNATVTLKASELPAQNGTSQAQVVLENKSDVPAFFLRLNLLDGPGGDEVAIARWSDNYLTLWPHESLTVTVGYEGSAGQLAVDMTGANVRETSVTCSA